MSRLPLKERLEKPMARPKELVAWSIHKTSKDSASHASKSHVFDDSALRYYYLPQGDIEKKLDLSTGFDKYIPKDKEYAIPGVKAEEKPFTYLDDVLKAIMHHEKENGRLNTQIVTWRGILTRLISLSFDTRDALQLFVVNFDGQIFIDFDNKFEKERRKESAQKFPDNIRFMYTGFNFEKFATLDKKWGNCTRDEIEARYRGTFKHGEEYGILVQTGVGKIKVACGAEVDCVEFDKDPNDKLGHYVELKTNRIIRNQRDAVRFEEKMRKAWLQSFLAGVPKIVFGYRDDQMILQTVEEYPTTSIPTIVNGSATPFKFSGKDAISFFAVLLAWLQDVIKPDESYLLRFEPGMDHIVLEPHKVEVPGRKVGFLLDEFVEWRRKT